MSFSMERTSKFKRGFKKLNPDDQLAVAEAIKALAKGKPYPNSLRVKKVQKTKDVYEASPTMGVRMTFQFRNPDVIILRNVGPHDLVLKNP